MGYSRASDSRLRRTLYDLMDAAGVERDGRSFHEFKKTYISRLVAEVGTKMSLFEVARLARCSEQVLTRHYLKLGTNRLRDLMTQVWDASALAQ